MKSQRRHHCLLLDRKRETRDGSGTKTLMFTCCVPVVELLLFRDDTLSCSLDFKVATVSQHNTTPPCCFHHCIVGNVVLPSDQLVQRRQLACCCPPLLVSGTVHCLCTCSGSQPVVLEGVPGGPQINDGDLGTKWTLIIDL